MLGGVGRWVLFVLLALAIVGMLAYARGEPGDDGRTPNAEPAGVVLVLLTDHRHTPIP